MQYIILGVTVLIVLVNVLVGLARGFSRGLLRLITLILAAAGAFFLAKAVSATLTEQLVPMLEENFASNPTFTAFLQDNPVVGQSVGLLAQMLMAPILFLVCYLILKPLSLILYWIMKAIFSVGKPRHALLRLVGGASMGLLAGLIGVLVFVTPVMGYTQLFSETLNEATSLAESDSLWLGEYNEKYLAPAADAPIASALYNGLGDRLFEGLTTVEWDGEDTTLKVEWLSVIEVVDNAAMLTERPASEYGAEESAAVHAMAKGVSDSHLLSSLGSGALNGMSNAWLTGETFVGVAQTQTGDESVDVIFNGFLQVFSTTTPEDIGQDFECFADIFDLLVKYEIFSAINGEAGTDALVTKLATSGFLEEARDLLLANERMRPVVNAISDAGMRMLIRQLGAPESYKETYAQLMGDMSSVLKGAVTAGGTVDTAVLSEELDRVFAEHHVTVPPSSSNIIAEGLADEFTAEELNTLTTDEITDRMIERFSAVENISQFTTAQ